MIFILVISLFSCNLEEKQCSEITVSAFTHVESDSLVLYKAANGSFYKIIGPDEEAGWIVEILKSEKGYFNINIPDLDINDVWVKKGCVALNTRNYDGKKIRLYDKPNTSSSIKSYLISEQTVKVLNVCANWVYIEGKGNNGETVEGWLEPEMQCSSPYSTCP